MKKAIAIVSGGLDSVTLAYHLNVEGYDLHLLAFDYGQRHKKELAFAQLCAEHLRAQYSMIDLSGLGSLLKGSALTDDEVNVPDGHYADASMGLTVVPGRNAVMLAIGFSIAASENASCVAIGVHGGDHFIYPDCRPEFVTRFAQMEQFALGKYAHVELYTPFLHLDKAEIVKRGAEIGVPFAETWSCYKGENRHCGVCGTCVERREAFILAHVADPTLYQE